MFNETEMAALAEAAAELAAQAPLRRAFEIDAAALAAALDAAGIHGLQLAERERTTIGVAP